jgi:hypothetical protein
MVFALFKNVAQKVESINYWFVHAFCLTIPEASYHIYQIDHISTLRDMTTRAFQDAYATLNLMHRQHQWQLGGFVLNFIQCSS